MLALCWPPASLCHSTAPVLGVFVPGALYQGQGGDGLLVEDTALIYLQLLPCLCFFLNIFSNFYKIKFRFFTEMLFKHVVTGLSVP